MRLPRLERRDPEPLPWARPRRELLLLALVAVAALSPVNAVNSQDVSRVCLTRALTHAQLTADDCLDTSAAADVASRNGHFYSDKAPGLSALELPGYAVLTISPPAKWPDEYLGLWGLRLLSVGIAFLACAFLIGRVSEGLAPGFGGLALVASALGTFLAPFAVANFDHVPTAALAFAAFLLAWRRRPLAAGLAAGAALTCEYEAALIVLVLGGYVALQRGWALLQYVRGVIPGAALLAAYNWLAFGAPWHPSYHYVANDYATRQSSGFFGIGLPNLHALHEVFVGKGGLLVVSPVVLVAAGGLVLLGRRYPREAVTCAAITALFLLVNSSYFAPYGGLSPGPRFMIPALPFLALGLGPAFARLPRVATALTALSVLPMTALTLTWASGKLHGEPVWRDLGHGTSRLADGLASNVLLSTGLSRGAAAIVVAVCAGAALALATASRR